MADTRRCAVLATVGVPPRTETAPPFTSSLPATSRLTVITLSKVSPKVVRVPAFGLNLLEMAIAVTST